MTNEEAIKRMRKRICCEEPVQHFCTDNCMYGVDECEISIAIEALKKQIPMRVTRYIRNRSKEVIGMGNCPNCDDIVTERSSYCHKCGQRLDWGGEREDNDGNRRNC